MSRLTEQITKLALPVVEEEGCTLWDVEYVKEAGTRYLRVYIDKEGQLWAKVNGKYVAVKF